MLIIINMCKSYEENNAEKEETDESSESEEK